MNKDDKDLDRGIPTPDQATQGDKPLQAEEGEEKFGLYPPDISPTVEIGGSPEEQQALNEEMTS